MIRSNLSTLIIALGCCVAFAACGEDANDDGPDTSGACAPDQVRHPITNQCIARAVTPPIEPDVPRDRDDMSPDQPLDQAPDQAPGPMDQPPDADCTMITAYLDGDGDGVGVDNPATNRQICADAEPGVGYASAAGDCDDTNPARFPGAIELCDAVDNSCDGVVNGGITCQLYAHTSTHLYTVDPFARQATQLASAPAGLFDIDTHPDGTLYGITTSTLYAYTPASQSWRTIGSHGISASTNANGFAIDGQGVAYVTGGNQLYRIDLMTARSTLVGNMGGGFSSSGDCVVTKGNTLYMTSTGTGIFGGNDVLVLVNGQSGVGARVGATNHEDIYALTAAWDILFGLTGTGQLVEINPSTGASTTLHTFAGKAWYGAASTPQR